MSNPRSNQSVNNILDNYNYIFDYKTGDVIDPITGEVIDKIYVSEYFVKNKKLDTITFLHEVPEFSNSLNVLHLPISKYRCLTDILEYLSIIRMNEDIPVADYEIIVTLRYILKRLGRHPYTDVFKVAVLYIVLDILGAPIDMKILANFFNIPLNDLISEILKLKRELFEKSAIKPKTDYTNKIIKYIELYGRKLELPQEILNSAIKVVKSKPYPARFTPRTVAAAILYVELERHNMLNILSKNGTSLPLNAMRKVLDISTNLSDVIKFVYKYYYGDENAKNQGVV